MPAVRTLELFCGIGGCAAALGEAAEVAAAVDLDDSALRVYTANFPHPTWRRSVESLSPEVLGELDADLWWLSPPCQPYTRRGNRRDLEDPRSRGLIAVIAALDRCPPRYLALENVLGFAGSDGHRRLRSRLTAAGFRQVYETELCPTELGVPNRRPRFYLVASREEELEPWRPPALPIPLATYLGDGGRPDLLADPGQTAAYLRAMDRVEPTDPGAVAACFTAAYGRSPVRSGSYLPAGSGRWRRFAPGEILALLGFPAGFVLPSDLPLRRTWHLLGNSLSVVATRTVLAAVPSLAASLRAATLAALSPPGRRACESPGG